MVIASNHKCLSCVCIRVMTQVRVRVRATNPYPTIHK